MDRTDIQLFLYIVKLNSISKAAEQMHFTQSTVSYRLKVMEKELQVPLFHRKKGVGTSELTRHGELFVPLAEQLLALYDNIEDLQFFPNNLLTVAAIDSISSSVLSDVYSSVITKDPTLRLEILTGYSAEIYRLVRSRKADIGFIVENEEHRDIVSTPLFHQKFYVVRYARYPSVSSVIDPKSLDPRNEIYIFWGSDYEDWHRDVWGSSAFFHTKVDTVSLLQGFLTEEPYWAVVPGSLLTTLRRSSNHIQVNELDVSDPFARTCYMIRHRQPRPSRMEGMNRFEELLFEKLKELPDIELA